jgi:hypothetical protein
MDMDLVLSIVVLAAIVLVGGAVWQWRRGGARKQVGLMLVLAVVMIANVLILAIPDSSGTAPLNRATESAS